MFARTRRTTVLTCEQLEAREQPAVGLFDVHAAALYQQAFRRDASADGVAFWGNQIAVSGNRASVIENFLRTDEGYSVQVHDFYRTTLFRTPSLNDRSFWVGRLMSGATLDQVQSEILGSPEAFRTVGSSVPNFLSVTYQRTLGRTLDAAGESYWSGQLAAGFTRTQVVSRILGSPEGSGFSVQSQVQDAYRAVLGRNLDAGGQSFWTTRPNAVSNSYQLLAGVLGSQEFLSGIQAYLQAVPAGIDVNDANAVAAGFLADRGRGTTNPLDLRDIASLGNTSDPVVVAYNQNVVKARLKGVYQGRFVANVTTAGSNTPVPQQVRVSFNITDLTTNSTMNPMLASVQNPIFYTLQGVATVNVPGQSNPVVFSLGQGFNQSSLTLEQYPSNQADPPVPPRGGLGVATNSTPPIHAIGASYTIQPNVVTASSWSFLRADNYTSFSSASPIRFVR